MVEKKLLNFSETLALSKQMLSIFSPMFSEFDLLLFEMPRLFKIFQSCLGLFLFSSTLFMWNSDFAFNFFTCTEFLSNTYFSYQSLDIVLSFQSLVSFIDKMEDITCHTEAESCFTHISLSGAISSMQAKNFVLKLYHASSMSSLFNTSDQLTDSCLQFSV